MIHCKATMRRRDYTGADRIGRGLGPIPIRSQLTNIDGSDLAVPARSPLANDIVRHVGDPVARAAQPPRTRLI